MMTMIDDKTKQKAIGAVADVSGKFYNFLLHP